MYIHDKTNKIHTWYKHKVQYKCTHAYGKLVHQINSRYAKKYINTLQYIYNVIHKVYAHKAHTPGTKTRHVYSPTRTRLLLVFRGCIGGIHGYLMLALETTPLRSS